MSTQSQIKLDKNMPDTVRPINLNATNQIVREATKIAARDIRAPKAVREGTVVKTFRQTTKR